MVAGSEETKRQDFTVNSIQGQELITTEFECGTWFPGILEVMWGWWKRIIESGLGRKHISDALWVLWDILLMFLTLPSCFFSFFLCSCTTAIHHPLNDPSLLYCMTPTLDGYCVHSDKTITLG